MRTSTTLRPGQTANPNGRPKREWTMTSLIQEALEELEADGTPVKKTIARKLARLAARGDMVAIKEVNNRLDGMPKQSIEHDGEVKHSVTIYKPAKNKE